MDKILVIDDEKYVLTLCKYVLEGKGYDVSLAISRVEALKQLESKEFDMAVIDCTLGFYIGKDLISEIAVNYPNMGFIVMSGHFYSEEVEACYSKGAYFCLDKPFKHRELLDVVAGCLKSLDEKAQKKRYSHHNKS
ncbi:response regulator [Elusimicrobiota bacterium]